MSRSEAKKVLIAGLDCADPHLVFERWSDELPTFRLLMERGVYGPLTSTIPAITVPAWSSMFAGKDPGTLGFYGFRNRPDYTYHRMDVVTSQAVKDHRVWDLAGASGKRVVVVGVPQTYPVRPVNGVLVSGFLTPATECHAYTYPPDLGGQLTALLGHPYPVDVDDFRTEDKTNLLKDIKTVTDDHFRVVHHLMAQQPWDLFIFVEIGVDRVHHAFWKYHDSQHPMYEPGSPFEHVTLEYYKTIDAQLGRILEQLDDETVLLVVSDHGAQSLQGGFCINEWLRERGYLVLKDDLPESRPTEEMMVEDCQRPGKRSLSPGLVPFERVAVDWSRTQAWGSGGYYGRIFINVAGRESQGAVPIKEYEPFREKLSRELMALTGPEGHPMGTVCYKPEEVYRSVRNIPPDLIVYFGNLRWRSIGSLGHNGIYTMENDTGPDDANHAQEGMIIMYDPSQNLYGRHIHPHITDIAPTILDLMGLPVPEDMQGRKIPHMPEQAQQQVLHTQ